LQRKRARAAVKKAKIAKSKAEAGEYHKLLQMRIKEQRERRSESIAKRRASSVAKKSCRVNIKRKWNVCRFLEREREIVALLELKRALYN
jgi:hypothetical protein